MNQSTEQTADATEHKQTKDTTQSTATPASDAFKGYKKIEVDGGDLSGSRQANVVVDIGFGDRKY